MLEFLLEFLAGIFFEAVFEFAADLLGALVVRALEWVSERVEISTPLYAFLGFFSFGAAAGVFSVLLFPHPLIHRSRIPGISLVVSPILAGLGMAWIGSALRRRNKKPTQLESFTYGFAFALGMAVVRFFLAKPN